MSSFSPPRRQRAAALFAGAALAALATGAAAQPASPHTPGDDTTVEEVVVTGTPYAVSLDSATTSLDVLTRQAIDVAPAAGLGDVLNGQPGLRSTFHGPGASRPIIRGLSGSRVLVLQNGVGQVDASAVSPDHAVATDPQEAERIEVLRGPSALAYGGSAIGGVVNVIDGRVPNRTFDRPEGRVLGSWTDNGDNAAVSGALRGSAGRVSFAIDASHRESDDYDVPSNPVSDRLAAALGEPAARDGKVLNTFTELDTYGGGLSYIGEGGFMGLSVKRIDTTYGVPTAQLDTPPDPGEEGPVEIHLRQTRYDFQSEHDLPGFFERVRLSAGYADYQHAEIVQQSGEVGTRFLSDGGEGRLELVQRERDGWQGAVGLNALSRDLEAVGDEAFIPPTEQKQLGLFALQRLDRGGWGVEGGLRVEQSRIKASGLESRLASDPAQAAGVDWTTADGSRDFTEWGASIAGFLRPRDGLFLSLSLTRSARAPNESELYADGPHEGTQAYELGDPTIDSEKVLSLEGTARFTADRLRAEAHLYHARFDGYIEQALTGDVEDDLPVYRYFQTDARFTGAEAELAYDVARLSAGTLRAEAAYDIVRADLDSGTPARIPPWSVTGRLAWAAPRVTAEVEVRHVAEQDRVAAFELPTDSYTLLNVSASVRPFRDEGVRLFVDGRNLTDEEAREHASFLKDIAPYPGRSVRLGAAYSF